jgi:hypothetical protein
LVDRGVHRRLSAWLWAVSFFIQQHLCWLLWSVLFTSSCTIKNGWNSIISHAHRITCLEVDFAIILAGA